MASTYRPTLDEVRELAAQGNFVAIYRDLPADLETPVSVYLKLCGQGSSNGRGPSFLLESVEKGEQLGRYSFIGVHPPMTVTSRGDQVTIGGAGGTVLETCQGDPLERRQGPHAPPHPGPCPRPAPLHRRRRRLLWLRPGPLYGTAARHG